tara:strand:- start:4 stop:255 length:252 start_codon:yes stop_codon:yes gene_type:complete
VTNVGIKFNLLVVVYIKDGVDTIDVKIPNVSRVNTVHVPSLAPSFSSDNDIILVSEIKRSTGVSKLQARVYKKEKREKENKKY